MLMPLLLLLSVPVRAEVLTYQEVAAAVEAANPELAAARLRADAAKAGVTQSWTPDSPVFELERMFGPVGGSPLNGPEKSWVVRQEFASPPVLALRRRAAQRASEASRFLAQGKKSELLSRARGAFASLRLAWVERELLDENIAILRRVARVAEAKLAASKSGQGDALRAQVELTRFLGLRESVDHDLAADEAELSALMGRAPAPLPRPEAALPTPPPALELLEAQAIAARPELRAAVLESERAQAGSALARAELLPMLMVQYRRRNAPMTGRTHDAMLGLSVPLWFWRPAAAIKQADAERGAARAESEAMRLATLSAVRAARERLAGAVRLAEVYRTAVLPQAESALRTAEAAYQSDRGRFIDLLDAQRTLWDLALEHQKILADAEDHRAQLARAVGKEH